MHKTVIDVDALWALDDQVRLIDCRARLGDLGYGRRAYEQGHIPGAQHGDLDRDFAAPPGPKGRHPLPDRAALAKRFADWGVNDDDQLVFYDDAAGAFAARGWWLARWCGHEAAAVLEVGIGAWPGSLATGSPVAKRGNFSLRTPLTRTVGVAEIAANPAALILIDARTQRRFDGLDEPVDPVAGHIPGAHCRPFQGNLDDAGRFLPAAQLRERFASLADHAVCYCGSGVTAAHNVLAMRLAGFGEPALYPGSWSEWISDPERPIAP